MTLPPIGMPVQFCVRRTLADVSRYAALVTGHAGGDSVSLVYFKPDVIGGWMVQPCVVFGPLEALPDMFVWWQYPGDPA